MLSSLLTQLQTQLLSKRFLAGLLPVLLFIFGSGWMLYQAGLQSWFGKIDALKDPAILYSVLVIVLLVVAYLFSAINARYWSGLKAIVSNANCIGISHLLKTVDKMLM